MKYILSLIFFFSFISISVGSESSNIKDSIENNMLIKDEQTESFNESKIVKKLINNNVDIYGPNKDNNTRLHLAAFNGDYHIVELLLDNGADIDCQNKVKCTPLLYAAQEGHDEVVQLLIERGANLENQDSRGRTSLLLASGFSKKESIVNKLLESGANINHQDKDENTAIHWGAFNGCYEIVRLLLESGDDIHKKGNFECTPLCDAAQEGQDEIIQLLFDKGANLEDQDSLGRTPLLLAVKFSKKESTVNKLLKLRPNINHIDKKKKTALHYAVINRNNKLVELLLESGADIHKKGNFGCTPICDAAQEGQDEIIQLLFDKGANLEDQDSLGRTPLLLAVKFSKKESAINKLLKLGASINHIDKNKKTALHYAVINKNNKLVELLLKSGADPTNISIFQKFSMRKQLNITPQIKNIEKKQSKNIKNTHLYITTKKGNDEVFQLKRIKNNSKYKYL